MNTLLVGAYKWANLKYSDSDKIKCDCDKVILSTYEDRLKFFQNRSDSCVHKFCKLMNEFVDEDDIVSDHDSILNIDTTNYTITFHPFNVRSGEHRKAQGIVFKKLIAYWHETDIPVDKLIINLSPATFANLTEIMKGVTSDDIVTGIQIWETLPCKITQVIIHEPVKMPVVQYIMQKVIRRILPFKLRQKLIFTNQIYGDLAK